MTPYDQDLELVELTAVGYSDTGDAETVFDLLRAAGISHASADELVTLVPIAFGRRLLAQRGVQLTEHMLARGERPEPAVRTRFEDERFYRAAWTFAAGADDAAVESMSRFSDEVAVIDRRIAEGANATDLALTEPLVYLPHRVPRVFDKLRRWLSPRTREADDICQARATFYDFLAGHGLEGRVTDSAYVTERGDEWSLRIYTRLLAPNRSEIQLDFLVRCPRLEGAPRFIESLGGFGASSGEAFVDAQTRFNAGSLHVLLEAIAERQCCKGQVDWETWEARNGKWRVCIGPVLARLSENSAWVDHRPLLDAAETLIKTTELSREIHTVRVFRYLALTPAGAEGLLDGHDWPELREVVAAWSPPEKTGVVSVRNFMVLLPA